MKCVVIEKKLVLEDVTMAPMLQVTFRAPILQMSAEFGDLTDDEVAMRIGTAFINAMKESV